MKKILVTGASGFIGRHSLPLLVNEGYEIHATFSNKIIDYCNVTWHKIDLLDFNQVSSLISKIKPTYLLHFAWLSVTGQHYNSLENIRWVQATLELVRLFVFHQGIRFVVAGSYAEYDWSYGYLSESKTPLFSNTLYGTSKNSLQNLLSSIAHTTQTSMAWGRVFSAYGPNNYSSRLETSVICSLLKNQIAHCSDGNQFRDFIYVKDVAKAFVKLLESDYTGVINIGSGNPVKVKDFIYKIGNLLNRTELIQLGSISSRSHESHFVVADIERLSTNLSLEITYSLDEGLTQTIEWWKSYFDLTI